MRVLLFSYQVFGLINMCTTAKACSLLLISHLESNNRATFTQLKRYSINNLAVMTSIQLQNVKSELEKGKNLRGLALQTLAVTVLDKEVPYYNWTGFYWMNDAKNQLELGAYIGEATDHTSIPYGRGICGQVAVSGKTFEVPDVHAQDNYLACSLATKSEIVVPVYADEKLVGQIDIDSHQLDPFTAEDHELLEWVAEFVADRL